ncbi:MAG: ABC transporter ATP-binding protein [Rhodanobacteraceae bacterium]
MIDAHLVKRFPAGPESESFELNVHLQAGPGITVLFGSSGAGKSLTLNCIAGFAQPDEGRVLIGGDLYFDAAAGVHLSPQRRRCGYIFQDHALFPHMTVRENLRFAASAAGRGPARGLQRHRRINELLDAFQLAELAARRPAQLSGGQQQRAALARILVTDPRALLLDEPVRGLDLHLRQAFYDVLRSTRERLKVPILLVTHDLEECFELADSICIIHRGRFLQCGPRERVLSRPVSVEAARTLGVYNIVPAEISALDPGRNTSKLKVFDREVEGPYLPAHLLGDQGFLCVRESEIRIAAKESENGLALRLLAAEPSYRGVRLRFEHGVCATVSAADYEPLRGAVRFELDIPPSAVWFVAK